jgi:hypothetical protein
MCSACPGVRTLPPAMTAIAPELYRLLCVPGASHASLAALGAVAARVGDTGILLGASRVTF